MFASRWRMVLRTQSRTAAIGNWLIPALGSWSADVMPADGMNDQHAHSPDDSPIAVGRQNEASKPSFAVSPLGAAAAVARTMIFRQLYDAESCSYTYLVGDPLTGHAALIDPVLEHVERDLQLVRELGLSLSCVLETHVVDSDHVTGAGTLRKQTSCRTYASPKGSNGADRRVRNRQVIKVGQIRIRVLETPGHTDDSLSFLVEDCVFTGDALLIRSAGRTDLVNGNAGQLYDSITRVLFDLPPHTRVYPAHYYRGHTSSTIGEELMWNACVANRTRDSFIQLMTALQPRRR
jgi:sulfur dioxygenase